MALGAQFSKGTVVIAARIFACFDLTTNTAVAFDGFWRLLVVLSASRLKEPTPLGVEAQMDAS